MKRFLVLAGAFVFCSGLVGCNTDSRESLIDETVNMVNQAAQQVNSIKSKVNDAVKKANEKQTKLDLTDATKSADQLRKFGEEAQKIKRHIDMMDRSSITEEDRAKYVKDKIDRIIPAFKDLDKAKTDLNQALAKAEQLSPAAKDAVQQLREKIRDAEAPFEALAR